MNLETFMKEDLLELYLIPWGLRILTALLIFIIGRIVLKQVIKAVKGMMTRLKLDDILVNFLGNIFYGLGLAVIVLAALEQLGVKTTSALAILGAAGLAIGLSLQSSLANFASGVMLIIFRPFNVGDFIEAGGTSGVVEEITIFSTRLRTGDNRVVLVPNSGIYSGTIVNVSARDTRRIDLVFGIGYDDDIQKAKDLLMACMQEDERILKDPAPVILVTELGDSSIDFAVRPWVMSGDYWTVRSDMLQRVKERFDANGISIPYPQRDVHLIKEDAA